ncbi:MAG: GDSL-type esterase/lipase family protein [bacterium]
MRNIATLLIVLSFGFATTALFAQKKIMPLGNSITKGVGSTGNNTGYRKPLYNQLKTSYSINFVGTLEDGSGFDADHEGHPGWKSSQILSNISTWLNNHNPDMILFHIGTNDISASRSTQDIINDIDATLSQIWSYDSNIRVFLCSIIPRKDSKDANVVSLNSQIQNLVNQRKGSNPINHIDQYSVIANVSNWQSTLMSDYLHPNDSGYQKMANAFFDNLINYLTPVTPVELVSFSGFANIQTVHLSWQTASETNNFGFNIEHSSGINPFEKVGFVAGHGTTTAPKHYEFAFEANEPGVHKFRLQQVDTDGASTYSEEIEVEVSAPALFTLLPSYPNPFAISQGASRTNIAVDLPEPSSVRVAIFDILGREVADLFDGNKTAGRHSFAWNGRTISGSLVPSGTYFIRMVTPNGMKRQKIQVIR